MSTEQKNTMLVLFLSQFGIGQSMYNYMKNKNMDDYPEIVNEFKALQSAIYGHIWKTTRINKQLSVCEVTKICTAYCSEHYQWINEVGLKSVNNWAIWLCWHEGLLKDEKSENVIETFR